MRPIIFQLVLMVLGFIAMAKNANWEPFMAASFVCAAMAQKEKKNDQE